MGRTSSRSAPKGSRRSCSWPWNSLALYVMIPQHTPGSSVGGVLSSQSVTRFEGMFADGSVNSGRSYDLQQSDPADALHGPLILVVPQGPRAQAIDWDCDHFLMLGTQLSATRPRTVAALPAPGPP
jgi:hypothetical protein